MMHTNYWLHELTSNIPSFSNTNYTTLKGSCHAAFSIMYDANIWNI